MIGAVYTKGIEAAAGSCGSPPRPIHYSGISIQQTSYFSGEQNALFKTFLKNISVQYEKSGPFHTGDEESMTFVVDTGAEYSAVTKPVAPLTDRKATIVGPVGD